jgi:hypothetical protein
MNCVTGVSRFRHGGVNSRSAESAGSDIGFIRHYSDSQGRGAMLAIFGSRWQQDSPETAALGSQSRGLLCLAALGALCRSTGRGRSARAAGFSGRLSHFASKRPIWPAEAANPWIAQSPTTHRIAGSGYSRFASFTSSWPASSRRPTDYRAVTERLSSTAR